MSIIDFDDAKNVRALDIALLQAAKVQRWEAREKDGEELAEISQTGVSYGLCLENKRHVQDKAFKQISITWGRVLARIR